MTTSQSWFVFIGVAISIAVLYVLSPILTPFLVAALLAYLFNPIVLRLEVYHFPRFLAATLVFLIIISVLLGLLMILIPLIEQQIMDLMTTIPMLIDKLHQTVFVFIEKRFGVSLQINVTDLQTALTQHWRQAGGLLQTILGGISASGIAIISFFSSLILTPVVMFYLLRDWPCLMLNIQSLFPRSKKAVLTDLFLQCDEVLSAFLRGQFLVMLALAVLYTLGLWIIGVKLALLIGVIAGLLSIVPYLGFIIGIVSAMIMALIQFNDPIYLAYVGLVFIIAQSIEGSVLTPLLVGDKIGLHPVAVIFAILAGGQLFGFVGILLALPAAAVAMVFLRHLHTQYQSLHLFNHR